MPPYSHIHNHQQPFFCGGQVSEYLLIEFLLFIRKNNMIGSASAIHHRAAAIFFTRFFP
jgi:hypothetical protein